jgi:2-methylcitrate dehydratase PrpD
MASFAAESEPPAGARARAAGAVMDTIGVALAGVSERAARIVRETIAAVAGPGPAAQTDSRGRFPGCAVWGTDLRASAPDAALANGTAAHALDYDDMCFVSLAHPSAPLVPAIIAAGELAGASGRAMLDAYVVGFETQARLGRLMNPRHYGRGWHCTSTLGTIGAAAGASRLLGLDAAGTAHALAIAASSASGLKENFGTMVKPLHAGLAARAGVMAALLARGGLAGSANAIDGPQGFLHAFDSERADLAGEVGDLAARWEILETGITVKLYPSCAGTHPTLDAVLNLRARHGFAAGDVDRIQIDVDPIVPTILIHDRPASELEAKFSMPFCAAAAVVFGRVGIDTFEESVIQDPRVAALMPRVTMRADEEIGRGRPALTEARVRVLLKDGRVLSQEAHGARGYPDRPAGDDELDAKFLACAARALSPDNARQLLSRLRGLESVGDVRALMRSASSERSHS